MTASWNLEAARKHVGRTIPSPYPAGGTWTIVSVSSERMWTDRRRKQIEAIVRWDGTGNPELDGTETCGTFAPGGVLYDEIVRIDGAFTEALAEDPNVVGTYLGQVALKTRELLDEGADFETALGVASATVRSRMPVPLDGLEVEGPISLQERSTVKILAGFETPKPSVRSIPIPQDQTLVAFQERRYRLRTWAVETIDAEVVPNVRGQDHEEPIGPAEFA